MDTNLLSMSQQFSGLPMESLIGGPLNAAAKANSAMALTQTMFMLDTCFNMAKEDKDGKTIPTQYEPIMIDMILTRSVISEDKDGKVLDFKKLLEQEIRRTRRNIHQKRVMYFVTGLLCVCAAIALCVFAILVIFS